jgi:hypothetical protein
MTRAKSPMTKLDKSPSRPSTFASQAHVGSTGPGHYTSGKEFGKDVKGGTIGIKRYEKP